MKIVGIDGGGTKTEMVLCDEYGHVLNHVVGGPSSPTSQSVDRAIANIRDTLETLLKDFGGLHGKIDSLFAGISGGSVGNNSAMLKKEFEQMLPCCTVMNNGSDAVNALRSVVANGDALIAIAGTGSSVFANVGGEMHQVGGWGYLLGDEGSGFDLGQRALKSALRAIDGRGETTLLMQRCEEVLGETVAKAIPRLYAGGRMEIAAFARILLETAQQGDAVAQTQLDEAVRNLAETIIAAGRHIHSKPMRVAVAGSIWKNTLYYSKMQNELGENYLLCRTDLPPVYGSYVVAVQQIGILITEKIEECFRKTLATNSVERTC